MTTDIDIYRAAKLYIDQHGDQAALQAAMQSDAQLAAGDMEVAQDYKSNRSSTGDKAGRIDTLIKRRVTAAGFRRDLAAATPKHHGTPRDPKQRGKKGSQETINYGRNS